ncbi:MAG: C25 family cysteine peptidase, partial [bacterium]
ALTQQALKVPVSIEIFRMNSLRDTGNSAEMLILTADELDPSRLAQFHTEHDSMIVRVVKLSEIMNQFGFGIYNPVAVRDFIYYAYNFWSEPNLKYVILVGDGHYDYRNILNSPPIYFPPAACDSYFSDDFFVRVTDSTSGLPSVAIGRLPARSQGELDVIMGKIIAYVKEPEWGFWRNTFILAGDDEYVGYEGNQPEHTLQTDELRKFIYTLANIRNLFMIEFPMSSSLTKPLAREELIKMWNEGAVVVNYIGHGNYHLWAHEILFDSNSDVVRLNNKKKLSLMFSASCSVGEFYEPFRESTSEKLLRHPEGGTIISIGATGLTGSDANFSLNSRFFKKLFIQSPSLSCGLNFISAKLEGGGLYRMNDSQYLIIGDPALHLAIPPTCGFSFTVQPESFEAPCWIELHIASPSGFQGNAEIHAFDSEMEKRYAVGGNASMIIEYHKQGNPIFRGFGSINGTGLDMSFFVPKDVNYGSSGAKVVGYIVNQTGDCICGRDSISITGSTLITIIDTTGPEITIWLDDRSFVSGDTVSSEPILFAELSDTHGINITGAPGHSITMWIDNEASAEDLAPYFNYYEGSATKGSIRYKIGKIPQGTHTITIRAWDNLNNSSTKTVNFFVSEVGTIAIANILPYPSPFKNYTYLTFRLLKSGLVSVDIFTITGRKIWSSDEQYLERGFNMIRWDGIDKNGKKVAKGVYIYRMVAKDGTKDYILYGKLLKE